MQEIYQQTIETTSPASWGFRSTPRFPPGLYTPDPPSCCPNTQAAIKPGYPLVCNVTTRLVADMPTCNMSPRTPKTVWLKLSAS